MEDAEDNEMGNSLVNLICKTFGSIPATDNSTIAETFAQYGIPHYPVIPMRVDAN